MIFSDLLQDPNEIFYVLFTSGSTGAPKGVKLSYSHINNTLLWSKKYLDWKDQKIGIATQLSFDISMFDLFYGLFFSVPMHIFSNPSNPFDSFYEIRKNKITSIFSLSLGSDLSVHTLKESLRLWKNRKKNIYVHAKLFIMP